MARLSPEMWERIRAEYENSHLTTWELERIYSTTDHPITRQAIAKRIKKEGWVRLRDPETGDPVSKWAADKLAGIKPDMTEAEVQARIEILVDERVAIIYKHRQQWKEIEEIRMQALHAFRTDTFIPKDANPEKWDTNSRLAYAQRLFQMFTTAANGQIAFQEGERRAHSFDYKMQISAFDDGETDEELAKLDAELIAIFSTRAEGDDPETKH